MPVSLGVFYHEYRRQGEPFGLETLHFRQLCEMGQVRGMTVFVFSPGDLDHEQMKVQGYTPDADGRWVAHTYPLPEIVYLRGVTMDVSTEEQVIRVTAWLQAQGVKLLNSTELMRALGDKWLTHQLLAPHPTVAAHLPSTAPYCVDRLVEMLSLYPVVFIKHRFGFESRGLIRILKLPPGGYSCVVNDLDASRQRFTLPNTEALIDCLARYTNLTDDFIIQQGIELAHVQGHPFEVRVILNKVDDRWLRTGMVVRLSGTAELPFLAVGSERNQRPSEILPQVFGERSASVLDRVRNLARTTAVFLEQSSGLGGELALDFGFDKQGHPWLIEGNSKPFNLFIRTGAYTLRRKNMARVLEYAQRLAANG